MPAVFSPAVLRPRAAAKVWRASLARMFGAGEASDPLVRRCRRVKCGAL